jgi:hypothetical protein
MDSLEQAFFIRLDAPAIQVVSTNAFDRNMFTEIGSRSVLP